MHFIWTASDCEGLEGIIMGNLTFTELASTYTALRHIFVFAHQYEGKAKKQYFCFPHRGKWENLLFFISYCIVLHSIVCIALYWNKRIHFSHTASNQCWDAVNSMQYSLNCSDLVTCQHIVCNSIQFTKSI